MVFFLQSIHFPEITVQIIISQAQLSSYFLGIGKFSPKAVRERQMFGEGIRRKTQLNRLSDIFLGVLS
jgi:hypothetical protein